MSAATTTRARREPAPTFVGAVVARPSRLVSSSTHLAGATSRVSFAARYPIPRRSPCDRSNRAAFSAVKCSRRAERGVVLDLALISSHPSWPHSVARSASAPGSARLCRGAPSRHRTRPRSGGGSPSRPNHTPEFESAVAASASYARIEHPVGGARPRGAIGQTPTRGCQTESPTTPPPPNTRWMPSCTPIAAVNRSISRSMPSSTDIVAVALERTPNRSG